MKKRIFAIMFLLASVFVINDICSTAPQMHLITMDLPSMGKAHMSEKIAKAEFSDQKYWNNATFNSNDNKKRYDLKVELRDTESNTSAYKTISNGGTHVFNNDWQKYAGRTYWINLKSGTWTLNKTYTTGIWYISY